MTLKKYMYRGLLSGCVCFGLATPVLAANAIYLQIPGVTGDGTDQTFPGAILLKTYSQSFTDPVSASAGGAGSSTCGAITFQKSLDVTSEYFLSHVLLGTGIAQATVNFVHASGSPREIAPYTIKLTGLHVTSVSQGDNSATAGTALGVLETIKVVANRFEFSYTSQNADGSAGAPVVFSWNCAIDSRN